MTQNRFAGFTFLIEKYHLEITPNWHISSVSQSELKNPIIQDRQVEEIYPQSYWTGETLGDRLEFAMS